MRTPKSFIRVAMAGLLGLAVSLTFTSCDILDVEPSQSVSSDLALGNFDGFKAVLGATYDDLQDVTYYAEYYMLYPDALADNATNLPGFTRYDGVVSNASGAHLTRWGGHYDSINKTNLIIASVADLTIENMSEQEQQSIRDRLEGEARFLRALNYFDLMRTKSYEPGVVLKGVNGVPIRTEPTRTQEEALDFRARAPIGEVYAQIEDDLQQATSLLDGTEPVFSGVSNEQFVANKAAAQALLAQVYLYEKNFGDAASMASTAMSTAQSLLGAELLTEDEYVSTLMGNNASSAIFAIDMEPNQDGFATNVNEAPSSLTFDSTSFNFQLLPTDDLISAHDSNDVRLGLYDTLSVGPRIAKYTQAEGDGTYTDDITVIRVAEVLLIRIEALYENGNESQALTELNDFRNQRGLDDVSLSGEDLIDEILRQKRLELAFEGERFFDLKRRGMDIPKPQSIGTLPYDDFRILAPLPSSDVDLNDMLKQNPEY